MLGKLLSTSPLSALDSTTCFCSSSPDSASVVGSNQFANANSKYIAPNDIRRSSRSTPVPWKWQLHSTSQTENTVLSEEDRNYWDACRQALSALKFSMEEEDKILGKAFGHIHSPYWSEERKKEVPRIDIVNEILDYLRSLSLTEDDLCKLLKKFPEVLGCSFEEEIKNNVTILEKDWGIEGKTLKKLLLRNPKVLGYNVDCKGDCMAKCTRCWVRF